MTTNAERQAAYKKLMRKAGFVQVSVWVPADKKKVIHDFAELLALNKRQEIKKGRRGGAAKALHTCTG